MLPTVPTYQLLFLLSSFAVSRTQKLPHVVKPQDPEYDLIAFVNEEISLADDQIFVNLSSISHDVNLKLTRTVNVGSHVPVYTSKDGVHIERRADIPDFKDMAFYHDVQNGAALSIRKSVDNKGRSVRNIEGTILYKGEEHIIQPASIEHIRHKRSLHGISGEVDDVDYHILAKVKRREGQIYDYVTAQGGRASVRSSAKGSSDSRDREKRSTPQQNTIEYFLAVDFNLYSSFLASASGSTSGEKEANALADIKYYMCQLSNGVDIRYQSIQHASFSFRVQLSFIYIAQTAQASSFTEDYKQSGTPRLKIPASTCLTAFQNWAKTSVESGSIPNYDHGALNTGYDLITASGSSSVVGLATTPGVCSSLGGTYVGQSINEEHGAFDNIATLAHELGHSLNAQHDDLGTNGCNPSQQFIMAPSASAPSDATRNNTYRFSSCSINAMTSYVTSLNSDGKNCMLTTSVVYNRTEFDNYLTVMPGQRYTIHQQCKQLYGDQSYYCGGADSDAKICQSMFCYSPTDQSCIRPGALVAADGTTCGNKKWCVRSYCVYDAKAPNASDTCPSGDRPGTVFSNSEDTCADVALSQCYQSYVQNRCCKRCAPNERFPGCEYGDKADCSGNTPSNICFSTNNKELCCHTCRQLINCGTLSAPSNGNVIYSPNGTTTFGNEAIYSCSEGFELQGVKSVKCLLNETWESAPTPTCREITTTHQPSTTQQTTTQLSTTQPSTTQLSTTQPSTTQTPTTQPPTTQTATTQPPTTQPLTTQPPTTQSPTTQPPTTQPPTTQPATTQSPTTQPPTTQPPTTQPPTTQPPTTQPPTTQPLTTQSPTTQPPTTQPPTTQPPTTQPPTTQPPTTQPPTTQPPTTQPPTTQPPTTQPPTTQPPTTQPPTTQPPTTQAPTTQPPTTQPPTTQPPTTQPPTTQPPTTQPPTTQPPTTQPPTTQPQATQPPTTQPPSTQPPTTQPPTTQPPTTQSETTQSQSTQPLITQSPTTQPTSTHSSTTASQNFTSQHPTTQLPTTQPSTTSPPTTQAITVKPLRKVTFRTDVVFSAINNETVDFTEALSNRNSQEFKDMESVVCNSVKGAVLDTYSEVVSDVVCSVIRFYNGSVGAETNVQVVENLASALGSSQLTGPTFSDLNNLPLTQSTLKANLDKVSQVKSLSVADVDECATSSPCSSFAKCKNTNGSYTCTCLQGYTDKLITGVPGVTCVIPCSHFPCYNGGSCVEDVNGHGSCTCTTRARGTNCEINVSFVLEDWVIIVIACCGAFFILFVPILTIYVCIQWRKRQRRRRKVSTVKRSFNNAKRPVTAYHDRSLRQQSSVGYYDNTASGHVYDNNGYVYADESLSRERSRMSSRNYEVINNMSRDNTRLASQKSDPRMGSRKPRSNNRLSRDDRKRSRQHERNNGYHYVI